MKSLQKKFFQRKYPVVIITAITVAVAAAIGISLQTKMAAHHSSDVRLSIVRQNNV